MFRICLSGSIAESVGKRKGYGRWRLVEKFQKQNFSTKLANARGGHLHISHSPGEEANKIIKGKKSGIADSEISIIFC